MHLVRKRRGSQVIYLLTIEGQFPHTWDSSSFKIAHMCLQDFSIPTIAESTVENNFHSPKIYIDLCMNTYLKDFFLKLRRFPQSLHEMVV